MQSTYVSSTGFFINSTKISHISTTLNKKKVQYSEANKKAIIYKTRNLNPENNTFLKKRCNFNSACNRSVIKRQCSIENFKHNLNYKANTKTYSLKFPNGLPFEKEFYRKSRENSIYSKSTCSDYGSLVQNDGDPSPCSSEEVFSSKKFFLKKISPSENSVYYLKSIQSSDHNKYSNNRCENVTFNNY